MMEAILEMVSKMFEFGKQFVEVDLRHTELSNVLQEVMSEVEDMKQDVRNEETQPGKKRKEVLDAYFNQAERYKVSAQLVLNNSQEGQGILKRMSWVPSIQRHHKEGQELLCKCRQLREEGLTYDEVRTRKEKLVVEEDWFIGKTVQGLIESALEAINDESVKCIGIYGYAGPEKTNIMKSLHNTVFDNTERFKAVFWATAPEPDECDDCGKYNKALQNCVADEMHVDLDNNAVHNEVRSAGRIMARLQEIGTGRAVLFLDNLKKEFPAYELLGIPSLMITEFSSVNCILVFSTFSEDICKRMRCDITLKMELLERQEAKELFLHELKRGDYEGQVFSNQGQSIQSVAIEVAKECAQMPLAIKIIARSMASITDIHQWRQRLNALKGTISSIDNEEDIILEQLKFGYNCLDRTIQKCFLEASYLLADDRQASKQNIIEKWKNGRLIGTNRSSELADDQGHTVLNKLERACLLQVAPDNQTVTMNKWISSYIWKPPPNLYKTKLSSLEPTELIYFIMNAFIATGCTPPSVKNITCFLIATTLQYTDLRAQREHSSHFFNSKTIPAFPRITMDNGKNSESIKSVK